jgi:hypothetical protein
MKTLSVVASASVLVALAAGCGGSSDKASVGSDAQRAADLYAIDQIERTWHQAASTKDLDLMMSIWAPDATFTFDRRTYTGASAIRKLFSESGPFQPENVWLSDTPAYKIRTTVNGDKGTLYFECHYIDVRTKKLATVVAADEDVRKIDGTWLITNAAAATPTLKP